MKGGNYIPNSSQCLTHKHQLVNIKVALLAIREGTFLCLDLDSLLSPSTSPLEEPSKTVIEFCVSIAAFGFMVRNEFE